jgi:phenylalanyl-tRNA synthetase alpha chain
MKEEIEQVIAELNSLKCKTQKDVEDARVRLLGKKGEITQLFDEFRTVAPDMKKEFGKALNDLKKEAMAKIEEMKATAESTQSGASKNFDLTMPGVPYELGSRHPVSIVRQEIVDIFRKFGYDVAEGPEIEDDYHVFGALNFPPNHPCKRYAGYLLRICRTRKSNSSSYPYFLRSGKMHGDNASAYQGYLPRACVQK